MTQPADRIPPYVRPAVFATVELGIRFFEVLRRNTGVDLESAVIMLCVSNATTSPVMLNPELRAEYNNLDTLPDTVRGSISRRGIAERTGLPRETVRRKVADLCEKGLLVIDDNDRVRSPPGGLMNPRVIEVLKSIQEGVALYAKRFEEFGVTLPDADAWPQVEGEKARDAA